MHLTLLIVLSAVVCVRSLIPRTNGYADPSLDVPFVRVFFENKDLLIKLMNDLLEPKDNERITGIKEGPYQYDHVKSAGRLTVFEVSCETKSGTVIVEVQLKHVYAYFVREAQTDVIWKYHQEAEDIRTRYSASPVRLLVISNCVLFPSDTQPLSRHSWMNERTHEIVFKDVSMTFFETPKCNVSHVKDIHTSVDFWCYFFTRLCKASRGEISSLETHFPAVKGALDTLFVADWDDAYYTCHQHSVDFGLSDLHNDEWHRRSLEDKLSRFQKEVEELKKRLVEIGNQTDRIKEVAEVKKNITKVEKSIAEQEKEIKEWLDDADANRRCSDMFERRKRYERAQKAAEEAKKAKEMKKAREGVKNATNVNVGKAENATIMKGKETNNNATMVDSAKKSDTEV